MKRRVVLTAIGLLLGMSRAAGQPGYKISAEQLQQAVKQRFPVRHTVEGLLNFDVREPRLRLLLKKTVSRARCWWTSRARLCGVATRAQ